MSCQRREMCAGRGEGNAAHRSIQSLPTEILISLFDYFDYKDLTRLSCVCRRFFNIIAEDATWKKKSRRALVTNLINDEMKKRSCHNLLCKEKVRLSSNWKNGCYEEDEKYIFGNRFMPWICLGEDRLWLSQGPDIVTFQRVPIHRRAVVSRLKFIPRLSLREDICRFVHRDGMLICGGRMGELAGFQVDKGRALFHEAFAHFSDVTAVDCHDGCVVSGSKDRTLKTWKIKTSEDVSVLECTSIICNADRILSVAMRPMANECLVGSTGLLTTPVHLYNLERGVEVISFNQKFLRGAGTLDICWETPNTVLTTGYDTFIRLWDCRTGKNVLSWSDPFDSTVYCLASDHMYTVLSGTCNHGRVQLWDMRQAQGVQMYFISSRKNKNCSVYSIAFDPCNLYAGLDQSLKVLDFTVTTCSPKNMNNYIW